MLIQKRQIPIESLFKQSMSNFLVHEIMTYSDMVDMTQIFSDTPIFNAISK